MLLGEIAKIADLELVGNKDIEINGVNSIGLVESNQITFLRDKKYAKMLGDRIPGAIVLKKDDDCFDDTIAKLFSDDPELDFLKVVEIFHPEEESLKAISNSAVVSDKAVIGVDVTIGNNTVIEPEAEIGDGVWIGANVCIGSKVRIGDNCRIFSGVTIYKECIIGRNVIVHSNTVIGSDGFGYIRRQGRQIKVPQLGNVIIGDDVEIGSNVSIDRATFGSTIIEDNAKIDNLVQIAHNCFVGKSTAISAQTGLSGHTTIGANCLIGGQVGFAGHLTIGDGSVIYAQSGIAKSFPPKSVIFGSPAKDFEIIKTELMSVSRLPRMLKRVQTLEKKVGELENK